MDWNIVILALEDELEKISESKKPLHEKVVDTGAHALGGAGIGRTLSDLSWSDVGASPRRKTVGALMGAAAGLAYHKTQQGKKARRAKAKTAAPTFNGTATAKFLSTKGKTIKQLSPKIGRKGVLP